MAKKILFVFILLFFSVCLYFLFTTHQPRANSPSVKQEKIFNPSEVIQGAIYIRIIKDEYRLELWSEQENKQYTLYKSYPICRYSGGLGPKKKEGDGKSPEGFYSTKTHLLNPNSRYHLSFNIGYPNAYDRAHHYTGSFIMIHGQCVSIGCYAMTDSGIDEIYTLVKYALTHYQKEVPIHIYPFAMTQQNLEKYKHSSYMPFWRELTPAYQHFEQFHTVPKVTVNQGKYELQLSTH